MTVFPRLIASVALLSLVTGCGVVSRVSGASEPLNTFTLAPATYETTPRGGSLHLVVEEATSAGAVASDRILIKPNRVQAAYLPESRWSDPAPVLIQSLLLASLQNAGGFRLVGRTGAGLQPDYTLMTELRDFQADAPEGAAPVVKVGVTLTLVREADRRIVATRQFDATSTAPTDETGPLVGAFDAATSEVLRAAVTWVQAQAR